MTSQVISGSEMIPDLLRTYPHIKPVLERFGLAGCGGDRGPAESLHFFARVHGVDEAQLLAAVQEAVQSEVTQQPAIEADDFPAANAYKPFFLAAVIVTLTLGATWGTWLLWRIGIAHSFTKVSLFEINAHGHAQIYGWMGLFIMGFAYQALPRLWQAALVWPKCVVAVFVLSLSGILTYTMGLVLHESSPEGWLLVAIGGFLQFLGSAVFTVQTWLTYWRSRLPLRPYVAFVLTALAFFNVATLGSLGHGLATVMAASKEQLLWIVATFQAPLRDIQVHGLGLMMILGVSLKMLPALFELPEVAPRKAWVTYGLLLGGVLGEIGLFLAYRHFHHHVLAALLMVPWLMIAVGCVLLMLNWKIWKPFPRQDRSSKFIRTAYLWLVVSLTMLLLMPGYQYLLHVPFSHAYYGAIRHAITVGFISQMILGYGAKVIPILSGIPAGNLKGLWVPYVLINLGCFLRVFFQVMTDGCRPAFALIALSGICEVLSISWWAFGLLPMITGHVKTPSPVASDEISGESIVADVLHAIPAAEGVLIELGFTGLANPVLRNTVARAITLRQAAALQNQDLQQVIKALKELQH